MRFLYGAHIPFVVVFLLFVAAMAWSERKAGKP
jgi:hypothetical protein